MKSPLVALVVVLSFSCLIASYFLMPKVSIGPSASPVELGEKQQESDTLALPMFSDAVFERLILKRNVEPGDTLGYILRDKFEAIRDSLSAFAKTGMPPTDLSGLPPSLKSEIQEMVKPTTEPSTEYSHRKRYALRGVEREYLASEIMGAEDASTEIIGKLAHLSDAGKSKSSSAVQLQIELKKKQTFISSAKKKLARRETYRSVAKPATNQAQRPQLSDAQRDRILNISSQLTVDTQRVFAPIAGRYYRPNDGVGYIIAPSESSRSAAPSQANSSSGYKLKAEGYPILWGTAQRVDSTSVESSSKNELEVSIK